MIVSAEVLLQKKEMKKECCEKNKNTEEIRQTLMEYFGNCLENLDHT